MTGGSPFERGPGGHRDEDEQRHEGEDESEDDEVIAQEARRILGEQVLQEELADRLRAPHHTLVLDQVTLDVDHA